VSTHALALRRWLARRGASEIFVEHHDARTVAGARPLSEYPAGDGSTVLLHASVGGPLLDAYAAGRGRKLLVFHNFTPAHFFVEWDLPVARELDAAWEQLARLAPITQLAAGVSRFNADLLSGAGFGAPRVIPLVVDPSECCSDVDPATTAALARDRSRGGSRWLYVGRLSANKAQHDLVRALAVARRHLDPDARLWLVGSDFTPSYTAALRRLVGALDLTEHVVFAGSVAPAVLRSYYEAADVFVSASEHEGFGVPMIEAMLWGLPVVAYATAAVPETVGDAGVLLADKEPANLAAAVHAVLGDAEVRRVLEARGRARAAAFSPAALAARLDEVLAPELDAAE
jgi:glycosyltransferase involved in cell wall biosynthesis